MKKPKPKTKKKVTKKAQKKKAVVSKVKPLPLMPPNIAKDISVLNEAFGGDTELVLFFQAWVRNGRNSTKAYQEINKDCSYEVASVMGCRLLRKVKILGGIEILFESYGIGIDKYITQLRDGIEATVKSEVQTGMDDFGPVYESVIEPDHKTRRHYHRALGEILGVEGNGTIQINNNNQNLNTNQNIIDNINDDELDDLIS